MKSSPLMLQHISDDILVYIMNKLSLNEIVQCLMISRTFSYLVDLALKNIHTIEDSIHSDAIDYVCDNCTNVSRPNVYGNISCRKMKKMRYRWPETVTLDWDWSTSRTISSFMYSLSISSMKNIRFLTLKVKDAQTLSDTRVNWNYMDLNSLTIECEGTSVERVLTRLNVRPWDVDHLFIRGDVWNFTECVLYLPAIHGSLSMISTRDAFEHNHQDVDHAIRYITNMNLKAVRLCNVFSICCPFCNVADSFSTGVRQAIMSNSERKTWWLDVATLNMIDALVNNDIDVSCSVFKEDLPTIHEEFDPFHVNIRCVI
jgi:hypothetical protein